MAGGGSGRGIGAGLAGGVAGGNVSPKAMPAPPALPPGAEQVRSYAELPARAIAPMPPPDTASYAEIEENKFRGVTELPLSTFSSRRRHRVLLPTFAAS